MTRETGCKESLTVVRVMSKSGETRLIESAWDEDGEHLATRALESPVILAIGEKIIINEVPRADVPEDNLFTFVSCGIAGPNQFELGELAAVLGPDM